MATPSSKIQVWTAHPTTKEFKYQKIQEKAVEPNFIKSSIPGLIMQPRPEPILGFGMLPGAAQPALLAALLLCLSGCFFPPSPPIDS